MPNTSSAPTSTPAPSYQALRSARSEYVPLRHINYHVRLWGLPRPGVAPLVLVHGWMDVSASYQFMVDALRAERWVIAPDWRGFGLSRGPVVDSYWLADYLADLDALLDHYAGDQAVDLVGHSMGGHVVMQYAGIRPARIRRLVNLEGFGVPPSEPAQAAARYARWMDELKGLHQGRSALKTYADLEAVAQRLMRTNPRLTPAKAAWLAQHWARPNARGEWEILGDPAHKIVHPHLSRVDEVLALYRCISAPTLAVEAAHDSLGGWFGDKYSLAQYHQRLQHVPDLRIAVLPDAGHMLHHDQPLALAQLLEAFLDGPAGATPQS